MKKGIYFAFASVMQRVDLKFLDKIGKSLGWLFWKLLPGRRKMAIEAVRKRIGVSQEQARQIARQSFINSGRSFMEIFYIPKVDWRFLKNRVLIENPEVVSRLSSTDKPIVIASAHFGAWELCSGLTDLLISGSRKSQVVIRLPKDRAMGDLILYLRTRPGVSMVRHRNAARTVLKGLRQKELAAFLVDHNSSQNESVFLPFLGKQAAVNMGPALLALRGRALVQPAFLMRKKGVYHIITPPPLDTNLLTGTMREKIEQVACFYTREVEKVVRRCPEQWFWMHRRWKTQPKNS